MQLKRVISTNAEHWVKSTNAEHWAKSTNGEHWVKSTNGECLTQHNCLKNTRCIVLWLQQIRGECDAVFLVCIAGVCSVFSLSSP